MTQQRKSSPNAKTTQDLVSIHVHIPKDKHDLLANMAQADHRKIKHMAEVLLFEAIEGRINR